MADTFAELNTIVSAWTNGITILLGTDGVDIFHALKIARMS